MSPDEIELLDKKRLQAAAIANLEAMTAAAKARPRRAPSFPSAMMLEEPLVPARLRYVSWYFYFAGAASIAPVLGVGLLIAFSGMPPSGASPGILMSAALRVVFGIGFFWTARELRKGNRFAAVAAAITMLSTLLSGSIFLPVLFLAALGLIIIVTSWRDLR